MARSGGQEREPQALSGWRRSATRAQAPIALGGRDDMDRPLSDEEKRILETAAHCLPGGALGSTRLPDDLAFIVKRGSGSKLYDVSGREYIDYLMGSGPLILGHAHPAVVAAVRAQLEHGTTYFLVNEPIVALADELCRAVPCAEQVRFTSTGTEATFFALRAARAYRKRDKVMKFEGGYHGSHDYALMSASPKSPKAFPAATAASRSPRSVGAGRSCARSTRGWKARRISSRRSAR